MVEGRCPPALAPLWPLAVTNPTLFERVAAGPLALTYSIYGFFPIACDWVYGQGSPPTVAWEGRTRGPVALLDHIALSQVITPNRATLSGFRG